MSKKRSFSLPTWSAPLILLLVTAIAFGPLLSQLGFYWDDWAKILVARLWGLNSYFAYYAGDRPLSSWTHILFTPLLGETPLPWHILTLLLRWLSGCGLWWSLNGLWPRARRMNLIAALLFVVYPAFVSEPAAVTFHQQWLQYALFFLSLGCMITANRSRPADGGRPPRAFWALSGASLAAMLLQLSVTEYFVPLELVRPLLLWFLIGNIAAEAGQPRPASGPRLRQTLVAWSPYLLLTGGFTIWRLFFIHLPGEDPYRANTLYALLSSPLATLQQLGLTILDDEIHILEHVWSEPLNVGIAQATPFSQFSSAASVVAFIVALAAVIFLREPETPSTSQPAPGSPGAEPWVGQALLLGLVAVLLGPVPAWITGRQVVFDFHSDRYAMPAMFGAAVLLAGLIAWLAQRKVQRGVLAGFLVGLAVFVHLRVANDYRWVWKSEQDFFWELSWRAPGLQAPTALFMLSEPFPNQGLFSTSAALNLLYPQPDGWGAPALPGQPAETRHLAYWVYTILPRYNHAPDTYDMSIGSQFRTLKFSGTTPEDSLLVYKDLSHGSCLWVISQRDKNSPYLPELVKTFIPISNLNHILPEAQRPGYPPTDLIGPNPGQPWCYFFERADLARQTQDWKTAAALYDAALAKGFSLSKSGSESPYEWLPFVEGLARAGRREDAAGLSRQILSQDAQYRPMLCDLWSADAAMRQELACAAIQQP